MQGLNNLLGLYYRAESGTKVITCLWGNSKLKFLLKIYLAVYCLTVDLNLVVLTQCSLGTEWEESYWELSTQPNQK